MRAMWERADDDALLLVEHPPTYTLGVRTDPANILVSPETVDAAFVRTDRGGDVTFHGPGQLVGYPILNVPMVENSADPAMQPKCDKGLPPDGILSSMLPADKLKAVFAK